MSLVFVFQKTKTFSDRCGILISFLFLSLGTVDVWISEVFRRGRTLRVHLEKDKMLCMQSDDVVRDTTQYSESPRTALLPSLPIGR